MNVAGIELPVVGPLDVVAALKWLAGHATPGVDVVVDGSYRRAVDDGILEVGLSSVAATVSIVGTARAPSADELRRVRFILDLDRDIVAVNAELATHGVLRPLVLARPGLRVLGAWSPWEALIRIVLGQQVSVAGARTLAGRLARVAAPPVTANAPGSPALAFPGPAALARADLSTVGLTGARSRSISGLARAVDGGSLLFGPDEHPDGGPGWLADLARQPGIGPWTISELAMRVLRDADAWPAGDLVLRRACAAVGLDMTVAAREFRPWRAYAATHLWESAWPGIPAVTKPRP